MAAHQNDFPELSTNWRAPLRIGFAIVALTFGACGGWAAVARLDGAAIGPGVVAVESNKKTVQHFEGGIVSELLVRDGHRVQQGDLLVRLDRTRAGAASDLYRRQLAAALATEARLAAERDGLDAFEFPPEVLALRDDPIVQRTMVDQGRQFDARRQTLLSQVAILKIQIEQIRNEINGIKLEQKTAEAQLVFVNQELDGLRQLWAKKLTDLARLTTKEVEQLRLRGVVARALVDIARAEQRISETQLKIEQLRQDLRQEASQQLPDIRKSINDVRQEIIVAQDTLQRIEIRAPTAGTVQQLRVFTIGGVLKAGEPILDIVPVTDELVVRARISPNDVHTIQPGMIAEVRFPAFHRASLPLVTGAVRTISNDRLLDDLTKEPYFAAEVTVDRQTIPDDLRDKLTAGLAADVIIPTGERTALQYLISPLVERFQMSMRER